MSATPGVYGVFCEGGGCEGVVCEGGVCEGGVCERVSLNGANVDEAVLAPSDCVESEIPNLLADSKEDLGTRPALLLWLVPGVTSPKSGAGA